MRGTGARGSKFRNHVYRQLGKVEAADQTEVARYERASQRGACAERGRRGARPADWRVRGAGSHSQIVAKGYVDPARVSVWGWVHSSAIHRSPPPPTNGVNVRPFVRLFLLTLQSYGGYLTSKIIENDNSSVFEAAVAVAPVSDWRYYGAAVSRVV